MQVLPRAKVSFLRTPSQVLFPFSVAKLITRPKVGIRRAPFYSMAREWRSWSTALKLTSPLEAEKWSKQGSRNEGDV